MDGRDTATWRITLEKYLLITPVALVPILLFVFPIFLICTNSFPLENYFKIFTTSTYLRSLQNSFLISILTTVAIAPTGLLIVVSLRDYDKARRIARILSSLPLVFSSYVFCLALIYIYGRTGIVNYFLSALGIDLSPLFYSIWGIIFANILFFLPYFIIPLFATVAEINPTLEEAAESLGSHGFHKFRTVVFPQILYGFVTGLLITFLLVFNQISVILALGAGRTYTLTYQLFAQYAGFQYEMANAIAVVSIMITSSVAVIFHIFLRKIKR